MPEVVLLHGFTHTSASWDPVVRALGPKYRAVRLDLPGHAASEVAASFAATRSELDAHVGEGAVVCGYSMGGRVALDWAVASRPLLRGLVLVSASPGIADDSERSSRRMADEALADRIEGMSIEAFVDEWERNEVLAGSPAWLREDRLRNSPARLAGALRGLSTGVMEPLWGHLDTLSVPVCWVVGSRDAKFRAIAESTGQPVEVIDGAGHAVHAERPDAVAALLGAVSVA